MGRKITIKPKKKKRIHAYETDAFHFHERGQQHYRTRSEMDFVRDGETTSGVVVVVVEAIRRAVAAMEKTSLEN